MKPKISIVTPVRNAAGTLSRCLDAVQSQSDMVLEHIVVDGHSTDGSREILRSRENGFMKVIDAPPRGIADAFNVGVVATRGDVIGIVAADDWYEPGAMVVIARSVNDDATILHGRVRLHDPPPMPPRLSPDRAYDVTRDFRPLERMPSQHPSCFVPRSVYARVGLFSTGFRLAMDYEFLLRCHLAGVRFRFLEEVIVNHASGGASSLDPGGARREVLAAQILHTRRVAKPVYLFMRDEWRLLERRFRRRFLRRRRAPAPAQRTERPER
jgi:glycosyltransferase involved in cell wall biosynthesis